MEFTKSLQGLFPPQYIDGLNPSCFMFKLPQYFDKSLCFKLANVFILIGPWGVGVARWKTRKPSKTKSDTLYRWQAQRTKGPEVQREDSDPQRKNSMTYVWRSNQEVRHAKQWILSELHSWLGFIYPKPENNNEPSEKVKELRGIKHGGKNQIPTTIPANVLSFVPGPCIPKPQWELWEINI